MGSMNRQKVIVGGVVAGIILIVLDYVVGMYVMGPMSTSMAGAISAAVAATMNSKRSMIGGVGMDLLFGLSIVWCYAAIRPRYGAGPKTGMCAASFVWFIELITYGTYYLYRLMSLEFFCIAAIITLVEYLIAGYVGCSLYSENAA